MECDFVSIPLFIDGFASQPSGVNHECTYPQFFLDSLQP